MDIINIIISFIELLSVFLIYNMLFNNILYKNILMYTIMAFSTSILYFSLVKYYSVDQVIALVGSIFLNAIIINKIEKKDTIVTLIELIVSTLFVLAFELITMFIIHMTLGDHEIEAGIYCVLLIIIMFLLIILFRKLTKNKKIISKELISKYKEINIIILNLFVFFMFIKVLLANDLVTTSIAVQITILSVMLIGINSYFYVYLYKMLNEKKKTEIQRSFNPLINELMAKVKANEHEYKNHLNAIWGIAQVAETDELRSKIKDYIGSLVVENEEFSKLLHIDNTIIKAVLYNKIQRAEKLGVSCTYMVNSDLKWIPVDDSELTVIFSNLLNNAIEATTMIRKKEVEVIIEDDDAKYYIIVRNSIENFNSEIMPNMFKMGYSTKGEGRGYGLYNIKKIIDKHKGKIQISLDNDKLTMTVIFNK